LIADLSGKTAIITGGGQGLGFGISTKIAGQGANIIVTDLDDRNKLAVEELAKKNNVKSLYLEMDVTDSNTITDAIKKAIEFSNIDILVNNAGVSLGGNIDSENFEDVWKATFSVNLDAQMRLIRGCLSDLMRNQDGRIVNIASTEGLGGSARISPYTASKHGVVGLTKALAVELGPMGVTVNAVCPGPINTGMTDYISDEDKAEFARRRTALKRFGNPEEVAHITLALVLPSASYITGAAIPVDGGLTARNN